MSAAVVVALGAAACGNEGSGEPPKTDPVVGEGLPDEIAHPVTTAIDRLQRAFVDRDYDGICAVLTPAAAHAAGEAAHGTASTCRRDIRRLLDLVDEGGGWRHAGEPRVTAVDIRGSRATATVALDRRWQARVPLTRHGGRWRLAGFFGVSPDTVPRVVDSIPRSDFPAAGGQELSVIDAEGRPCPDLSQERYPVPSGGCRVDFTTAVTPLTILTPLGDFQFDRCSIDYRVLVDSDGRTWTDRFEVNGGPRSVACGDVNACYDAAEDALVPWRGRIHPQGDGSWLHRVDMCLRTCVGSFIGKLTLRLQREDGAWRAEPVGGGGNTGFRFDSPLRVRGDFDIQPVNDSRRIRAAAPPRA